MRDRALIGLMVYTFARASAALQLTVRDYVVQARRGWVRLHEKGGKELEIPCHHNLERYLDAYEFTILFPLESNASGLDFFDVGRMLAYDLRQALAGNAQLLALLIPRQRLGEWLFLDDGLDSVPIFDNAAQHCTILVQLFWAAS